MMENKENLKFQGNPFLTMKRFEAAILSCFIASKEDCSGFLQPECSHQVKGKWYMR